jgi:dTDP-4-dehydrorhamnose 3,5-epimerase
MKFNEIEDSECFVIEPDVYEDSRGYFLETFNLEKYEHGLKRNLNFVQDNFSFSVKKVLRGLHIQKQFPQGKLIMVTAGEIFDVAVDLRADSNNFGKCYSTYLSGDNKKQFWIPEGFAHGFVVLSEIAHFNYKCTNFYYPDDEISILWNDKELDIDWPIQDPTVSQKDLEAIKVKEFRRL